MKDTLRSAQPNHEQDGVPMVPYGPVVFAAAQQALYIRLMLE